MKQEPRNHELIAQYLLGDLSEQEKMLLEEQYFDDDDFFEQMLIVESELIDGYVRGELSAGERKRFEAHFLASPRLRQRVEIATAIVEYATKSSAVLSASENRKPAIWWPSFLDILRVRSHSILLPLAASVLLIAVSGSLFIFETARIRNQARRIEADRAETLKREQELQRQLAEQGAYNKQLEDELQRERSQRELLEQALTKPQQSALSAITFMLTPDLVRGASETKKLTIPQHVDLVRFNLDFEPGGYKSYRAVLETVDGDRIWRSASLQIRTNKSGRIVTFGLPASLFSNKGYILTLSGVNADGSEKVAEYFFSAVRKPSSADLTPKP